jgi:hypothetical protein
VAFVRISSAAAANVLYLPEASSAPWDISEEISVNSVDDVVHRWHAYIHLGKNMCGIVVHITADRVLILK